MSPSKAEPGGDQGVQALNLVDKVVGLEALRQARLLEIKNELISRGARVDRTVKDVTAIFAQTGSKVLSRSLKNGGVILACRLVGFAGLVARSSSPIAGWARRCPTGPRGQGWAEYSIPMSFLLMV